MTTNKSNKTKIILISVIFVSALVLFIASAVYLGFSLYSGVIGIVITLSLIYRIFLHFDTLSYQLSYKESIKGNKITGIDNHQRNGFNYYCSQCLYQTNEKTELCPICNKGELSRTTRFLQGQKES